MLHGAQMSAQAGAESILVTNGMPSGFPNTAIFDSLMNIGQLYAISKISGVIISNVTVQGDDVIANILT
jgi:hypothetical protein